MDERGNLVKFSLIFYWNFKKGKNTFKLFIDEKTLKF